MSEYKALYRKWRPQTFDDVCGQSAITDILKYEVMNNKLSHAYLFCGSRGTGKTTCAKILAKAVNCLNPKNGSPCNECYACKSIDSGISTDVMELDAASNTGVDNVRNMKDEIAFTPSELKYRVYIIDEIHMMSISAFNALLKTLEEPPSYVIFILATTEFHKLPTTIVSRCQRFDFKRISSDIIIERLLAVAKSENIDITSDAARVIARISRGGMRDAISLLELCAGAHKTIDEKLVFETVGSGNRENAYKLIKAIGAADFDTIYSIIGNISESSGDISVFWQEIIESYRDVMIVKATESSRSYLDLTEVEYEMLRSIAKDFTMNKLYYHTSMLEKALEDMQRAINSKRAIAEIALTRMCDSMLSTSTEALALRIEELEKTVSMLKLGGTATLKTVDGEDAVTVLPTVKESAVAKEEARPEAVGTKPCAFGSWSFVLEKLGDLKKSLSVQFIGARAYSLGDGVYKIRMNPFFATKLSSSEQDLALLRGIIADVDGISVDKIRIQIEPLGASGASDIYDELDSVLNN